MTKALILVVSMSTFMMILAVIAFVKAKYETAAREKDIGKKPYLTNLRRRPR